MNLRERTAIDRPAALVWRYIVTPELFQQWNDKIVAMEARGAFQPGQHFHARYAWRQRELQCWSQMTRLDDGRLLELPRELFRIGHLQGHCGRRTDRWRKKAQYYRNQGRDHQAPMVPWYFISLI